MFNENAIGLLLFFSPSFIHFIIPLGFKYFAVYSEICFLQISLQTCNFYCYLVKRLNKANKSFAHTINYDHKNSTKFLVPFLNERALARLEKGRNL